MRFPIAYGRIAPLLTATGMPARSAHIDVDEEFVSIRMGIWFSAKIARSAITRVELDNKRYVSIGVHGWGGRWLVNGKAGDFVKITINPTARAKVGPVTVKLRELVVSLENPTSFIEPVSYTHLTLPTTPYV